MEQTKTLRGLARAYATGQIEKDQYRQERAIYLQDVLSGKVSIPEKRTADPVSDLSDTFSQVTVKKDDDKNNARKPVASKSKKKPAAGGLLTRQNMIFAGIILVVIIVSAVILIPKEGSNGVSPENSQTAGAMGQNSITDRPPSAAENLIASFIEQNTWTQGNLDTFLINWRSIAESQRTTARTSTEFSRLVNAIYKKLLEERALSRIGNAETAYEKQRILVEFATAIGIRDQRIALPEPPPENMP